MHEWGQELNHIHNLDKDGIIGILNNYTLLLPVIDGIQSKNELNFILDCINDNTFHTLAELREDIFENENWRVLVKTFKIDETFIKENQQQILNFLYKNGAYIVSQYISGCDNQEALRRLLIAELSGQFQQVKYFHDDLEREIEMKLLDEQKLVWQDNMKIDRENLCLYEEDDFLYTMQLGTLPNNTCLSYINGIYRSCLLSSFDTNKKVLFIKLDNKIVFRAIVRLTKGRNDKTGNKGFQFADIEKINLIGEAQQKNDDELVIFLERPYINGLSTELEKQVMSMAIEYIEKKSAELNAKPVLSLEYSESCKNNVFVMKSHYIYISKSKASKQYLDSLGGEVTTSNEGEYIGGMFLMQIE